MRVFLFEILFWISLFEVDFFVWVDNKEYRNDDNVFFSIV